MTNPQDRVLDWRPRHDPRSLSFAAVDTITDPEPAYKWWGVGNAVLDQGADGACVGHGVSNAASSRPNYNTFRRPQACAFGLYHAARFIDQWPGENYDGTSVLAGVAAARDLGMCASFLWCFGIDDVRRTVKAKGPVVIGIPWLDTMFDTDTNGLLDCTGKEAGGHCVLLTGEGTPTAPGRPHVEVFRLRNSWGNTWGLGGDAYIRPADLEKLLGLDGEAALLGL